jgi:hypothetical protein
MVSVLHAAVNVFDAVFMHRPGMRKSGVWGTIFETQIQITLRFAYSLIAAAAFGAAIGTVFRNIYNGFAIGVFAAFLLYLAAFCGFVIKLHHFP